MRWTALIPLTIALLLSFPGHAQLDRGLNAYQGKNYEEAKTAFEETLKNEPHNTTALFNLGLTFHALGQKGAAVARWRRALEINPFFTPAAEALEETSKTLNFSQ